MTEYFLFVTINDSFHAVSWENRFQKEFDSNILIKKYLIPKKFQFGLSKYFILLIAIEKHSKI